MPEESKKIHASPTKEFFINMITRDIGLEECIFDLLDNSLDGANRQLEGASPDPEKRFAGYYSRITIADNSFIIEDNCGGIALDDAVDYAFHFGRRTDAPDTQGNPIGLYGIGMKRAVFKIGKSISIESITDNESFAVNIDVDAWSQDPDDWDFDVDPIDKSEPKGTLISISNIKKGINSYFTDPNFANTLVRETAKYYSFFLQQGFKIHINEVEVLPHGYQLKQSAAFQPIHFSYQDEEGVTVAISAGLAGTPPEDTSPEVRLPKTEYYGWFVLCNERVVLAGDKTRETGWGIDPTPNWHPQYNGFMGIVSFTSHDAKLLPWTTTKREIDLTSEVYRRALVKMQDAVRPYLNYTNARKDDIEAARKLEDDAVMAPVQKLSQNKQMRLPTFKKKEKVEMATILYTQPKELVLKVAESLGNRNMAYKYVGIKTLEYYIENEMDD